MTESLPDPSRREKLNKFRKNKLRGIIEQWCPYLFGISAFVCSLSFVQISLVQYQAFVDNVLPIAVTIASVFAGFQMTAPAILVAIDDSASILYLKKRGSYKKFVHYIRESIISTILFILLSTALILIHAFDSNPPVNRLTLFSLSSGLFVLMIASSVRIVWFMLRILLVEVEKV